MIDGIDRTVEDELYKILFDSTETKKFKEILIIKKSTELNPSIKEIYESSIELIRKIRKWQKGHYISLIVSGLFIAREVYCSLTRTPYAPYVGVVSCIVKVSTAIIFSQIAYHEVKQNIKELSEMLTQIIRQRL